MFTLVAFLVWGGEGGVTELSEGQRVQWLRTAPVSLLEDLGSIPNTGRKCGSDQSFHNLQKQWEIILFTGCEFKQTLPEGGS